MRRPGREWEENLQEEAQTQKGQEEEESAPSERGGGTAGATLSPGVRASLAGLNESRGPSVARNVAPVGLPGVFRRPARRPGPAQLPVGLPGVFRRPARHPGFRRRASLGAIVRCRRWQGHFSGLSRSHWREALAGSRPIWNTKRPGCMHAVGKRRGQAAAAHNPRCIWSRSAGE